MPEAPRGLKGMDDAWLIGERRHEYEMADIKSRDSAAKRAFVREVIGWTLAATTAMVIVGIIGIGIYKIAANATDNGTERLKDEAQREVACYQSGGTRVTLQGGDVLCLHLGQEEAKH